MRILLLGLLLATAACKRPSSQLRATLTPVPSAELPDYSQYLKAGDEWVALGTEPRWSLTINPTKNRMQFKLPGTDYIGAPVPDRITDSNGSFRYTAETTSGRLTAVFRPDSCVDALSGQRFDYRVDLTVGRRSYSGCGLPAGQIALLQDIWVLTELNGKPVMAGETPREQPRLDIRLTQGQVSGTTGCNQLSGSVRADTRRIQFGPLITTRMACLDDAGNREGDFLAILREPLTYRVGQGRLTLLRNDSAVMVFKKGD